MAESFKVEGLRDLENALRELPKTTARATLVRTGKKALQPFLQAVKAKAPRAEGNLAESYVIGGNAQLTRRQKSSAKKEGKFFAEVHAGTSNPAGVPQEFGTVNHAAQPHGRPAWDQTQDEALVIFQTEIWTDIEKTAARLARRAARLAAKG